MKKVSSVAYRAGIVKQNDVVHGVLFKGTEDFHAPDSSALYACIPSRLASLLSIGPDDCFNAYFIGDRVKARRFTVLSVYDDLAEADDRLVLYTGLSDVRRINGWDSSRISAFEIMLDENRRDVSSMSSIAQEVGSAALLYASDDDPAVVAMSAAETYPQIFDWLSLIDFNVLFVLVLMTAVAGFNMISGLLILLFENISTIGILKSMGMTDRAIMSVFLRSSSSLVLKGMLSGNLIAVLFCAVQSATHVLTLDPDNYFISFVPVHLEAGKIVAADVIAYLLIMLSLLLPSMFISRVDPARTVRMS